MNKYHSLLEFDKILALLKEECVLQLNKKSLDDYTLMNDVVMIDRQLSEVDEAVVLTYRFGRIPLFFSNDIAFYLSKVRKNGVLHIEELVDFQRFIDSIKSIMHYVDGLEEAKIDIEHLYNYTEQLYYPMDFHLRMKEVLSPYGEILDSASSTIKEIRRRIKDTEKNIQSKLQEIIQKNSSKLSQTIVSMRNDRYVIPVKNEYKNTIKGIQHDQSASKETVFIEPAIIAELNNRLNELREDEQKEIYNLRRELSEKILLHNDNFVTSYNVIIHLDMTFAKAALGIRWNCTKPDINQNGIVDLLHCRHPLLNVEHVVPNSISIGKNYKGIIITGPNTGGKTVLLKTLGLLSLMVKFGLLIPCSANSSIMIFDNVYADIGDEQSIDQNLSTFSSHLRNVIDIMNQVSNKSLVLLDELGSGTDPAEGSSLAIAIFDSLIEKNCLVVATSHYNELKVHAYQSNNIINASVEFDIETLKPTYKLLIGIPGQSNALKIAKILGLNKDIITRAEKYAYEKSDSLSQILEKLTLQSRELDQKLKTVEYNNNTIIQKIKSLDLEMEEAKIQNQKMLQSAEIEAKKLIQKSMQRIDDILKELEVLRTRSVKLHEIAEVKHQIRTLKEEASIDSTITHDNELLSEGDYVFVESYGSYGTILKINKNKKADVQIGIATVKVDIGKLKLAPTSNYTQKVPSKPFREKKQVSMSLDLRGDRYEDAQIKLEKYIDDAIYAGLIQVSIIHGFGTGVIRELVQTFLKTCSQVESYRYGGGNEGGQGATIVTLKSK